MKYFWSILLFLLPSFILPGIPFNNDHLGISFSLPDKDWEIAKVYRLCPTTGWIVEYNNPRHFAYVAFSGGREKASNYGLIDTALSMLRGVATQVWVVRKLQFQVGKYPTVAQEVRYNKNGVGYSALIVAFSRGERTFLFLFGAMDIKFSSVLGDFRTILQSIRLK